MLSSDPFTFVDGFSSLSPRLYVAGTTYPTSAISAVGFWSGYGDLGRGVNHQQVGMRVGDVLLHISSTGSATPGQTSLHSVVATSANQASTVATTGWGAQYDVTVSSA